ncbi:penicillin-binding transpeptidase domain-containing protein [Streptomyces stackebrandtii]|uniref:penicillin-binding transpeptidase domain-containing protein n=1 Tax=Streptomyces stackebrandtii TaxID=3051177 RepID=UPI0028DC5341|nr:penicillin-binding transpeptidase domain-containing protein [Streptomyces sp. DSM 40976]
MRSGAKTAIVGGVFLVVAGGVGYGGLNLYNGITGGDTSTKTNSGSAPKTGPVTGDEVTTTAKDFLAAWAAGEPEKAGQLTNDPVSAGPAVAAYRDGASISEAVITPGTPVGAKVPFTVKATITYKDVSKPWSYASELTVVRGQTTGRPLVKWAPSVLHPKLLTAEATVRTGVAKTAAVKAVDRNGDELTAEKYPSLVPIIDELRKRYGSEVGGETGVETWIDSGSTTVPDSTLLVLSKGKAGTLKTTIDPKVQAAAEKAVKAYGKAAVTAIEPSTGAIRAVANSPAGGFNTAFLGRQAPGSTMKIVTVTMMMQHGLAKPGSPVPCPATVVWKGRTFENLKGFSSTGDLTNAFRLSCNTTFIKPVKPLDDKGIADTALGETARRSFGIGLNWQVGVPASDGSVPASEGPETAASYIGQGRITMSALNVASLSATAKDGRFRQPYLVSAELGDREFAKAEPLSPEVHSGLRRMMNEAATNGTAAKAMAGVPSPKGAKTGSAEVDYQDESNSWFTGYSGDLAAAAVVQSGGHGGDAAGPVVARVLRAG